MSKVYGFCKAGCKYPVVKEDDFLKAAAFIEMDTNVLDVGNKYKIFDTSKTAWGLKIVYKYKMNFRGNISEQSVNLTLPSFDKYNPYLTIKICEVKLNAPATMITVVYDINDERKTYTYNTNDLEASVSLIENACTVENASKVWLLNETGGYGVGGGVTKDELQEMIDESITSLLTGDC